MEQGGYSDSRFGRARRTEGRHGYVAYFPAPIPRAVDLSPTTILLLTEAEAALGRLAGVADLLPNPRLLTRPHVLREAISSTRIEGTRASITDVLELEAGGGEPDADLEEVLGYVDALGWGLEQSELPLSVRLLRELRGCDAARGLGVVRPRGGRPAAIGPQRAAPLPARDDPSVP